MATLTATLATAIDADDTLITLEQEVDIGFYAVDSENIQVTGMSRGADGRDFERRTASVNRGVGGTTPASHLASATLSRYFPDARTGSGGAEVFVDLTDPSVYKFSSDEVENILTIGGPGTVSVNASETGGYFLVTGPDQSQVYINANGGADVIYAQDTDGNQVIYVKGNGLTELRPVIIGTSAPADGLLSSSQVALWFDATNGAAKLKIKGKSANGTVVVGEVALT